MSKRPVILGTLAIAAVVLVVLAVDEASYLQRGYSLSLGFAGQPPSVVHIDFPTWLKVAHGVVGLVALSALTFLAMMRRTGVPLAWATFVAAIAVGIHDVVQYGTLGSPTSIKTILLFFVLSILATYWGRIGVLQKPR
jgi:hypothetical protein